MRFTLRRPAHHTVVAYLALFVALGAGTAFAAQQITSKQIASGAVKSKQIKDGQVRTNDLAAGAVGSGQLGDGAVAGAKLADGSVSATKLAPGAVGAEGLAAGAVDGADVADGSLATADIARQSEQVSIAPGTIGAHSCFESGYGDGQIAAGDSILVLTGPSFDSNLYVDGYESRQGELFVSICNPTNAPITQLSTPLTVLTF